MKTQLTDNEALELKALIAPSDEKLAKIENLEEVKKYLQNLTELHFNQRTDIRTLPESISKLKQLTKLYLFRCVNLSTLPKNIGNLTQLKELNLAQCIKINALSESICELTQLQKLTLSQCSITTLPDNIGKLKQLKKLYLSLCFEFTNLPESVCELSQLQELVLSMCMKFTALPENIGNLKQLKKLYLNSCFDLVELPKSFDNLIELNELNLGYCFNLVPETFTNIHKFKKLTKLSLSSRSLTILPDNIVELTELTHLDLDDCCSLNSLPENIDKLNKLKYLNLNSCVSLNYLPDTITKLTDLEILNIYFCQKITELPKDIGKLKNLRELKCQYKNINELPLSFAELAKLEENYLRKSLEEIGKTKDNKIKLLDILLSILKLRENLIVGYDANQCSGNEMNIAHYTRPDIAMKLLKQEKDENNNIKTNPFQMGSIAYVNDPKEGKVIFDYFNELDELKNNHITLKPISTLATFVGCFTFNHDKLNHFRLYGKEQGKEATGVSIVLNILSFDYNHDKTVNQNKEDKKLPLYRCIYLNPKGKLNGKPYIQVACRDKVTFYREENRKEEDYKSYQTYIQNIQENVNEQFEKITKQIQGIFIDISNEKEKLIETVSFILLPLSYMVKHSAYEEEQECRIFKFLSFDNPNNEIKTDIDNKRMYVEYLSIDNCVEKIYLSPYAEKYADMFRVLINDKDGKKVRSSDNPFR